MDALLLRKKLPSTTGAPARRLLLKQINEDFRALQNLNNRMMSETWAREAIDYEFVSNMISQIRSAASRLKSNLNLPQPAKSPSELRHDPANDEEFRAALLVLDQTIMRFVKNPVFQAANTIDVDQARQARVDLDFGKRCNSSRFRAAHGQVEVLELGRGRWTPSSSYFLHGSRI
jgi:hypothetical protein